LLKKSEDRYDTVCSLREITDHVRAIINSTEQKLSDAEVLDLIEAFVLKDSRTEQCSYLEKGEVIRGVFNATRKDLDLLQPYADDTDVSEIMVNGTDSIFIEKRGQIIKLKERFQSREQLEEIIHRLAGKVHREINELNPVVDARLDDGSRIHAVLNTVAINGPVLTIRRFPQKRITMSELLESGSITREAAGFLRQAVAAGYNIFISGGTSSGKTTFLNVLSNFIPKDERVIVIEDSAELQITGVENLVRMESRNANAQGKGEITIRQLIRASLRMRPDRVIVGEVRGEEVMDMLQAMNTGHDGSLSTGHANSPEGMLTRLETMYLMAAEFPIDAIRGQILEAIDLMVHLERKKDRGRVVVEISELSHLSEGNIVLNPLYRYDAFKGLQATGNALIHTRKMERIGAKLDEKNTWFAV